jgi:hypothetical protein
MGFNDNVIIYMNTVSSPDSVTAVESNQRKNEQRRQQRANLRLNNHDESAATAVSLSLSIFFAQKLTIF